LAEGPQHPSDGTSLDPPAAVSSSFGDFSSGLLEGTAVAFLRYLDPAKEDLQLAAEGSPKREPAQAFAADPAAFPSSSANSPIRLDSLKIAA